jgi:hypothetical protein
VPTTKAKSVWPFAPPANRAKRRSLALLGLSVRSGGIAPQVIARVFRIANGSCSSPRPLTW